MGKDEVVEVERGEGQWHALGASSDFVGNGPHGAAVAGRELVLLRADGVLRAWQGNCPHQGALLSEGRLEGGALVCRNHGWSFSVNSGERSGGPDCLVEFPLREETGLLEVFLLAEEAVPIAASMLAPRALADLPGPAGLPLLGNAHQLEVSRLHQVFEGWAAEFGPLYRYTLAATPFLVVSDPALVNEVLRRRPDEYRKISSFETIFAELGIDGVFVAEGDAWRSQRRLVMQALDSDHVKNFFPILRRVVGRLERRWQEAARMGREVDLVDEFTRFTVDVTTRLALATETNTLEDEQGELLGSLAPIFPALARRLNAAFPWWRYLRLPVDRDVDRARKHLEGWLGEVMSETRVLLEADPGRAQRPENFLEAMLVARDGAGAAFSEKVIFANALTMLLAGEDTTANTLGWALHLLLDAPEEVEGLRSQIDAVLGCDSIARDLQTLDKLTAIDAVANETMRLKPVAPFFLMENCVETVLGDVHLPAGTSVCLLTRVAGLDPARIADPLVFRPARWADEGLLSELQRTGVFVPFGSGPRSCPGRSFALLLIRYAVSTLLRGFEIKRVGESGEVREQFGFVMAPAGLRVRLRSRTTPTG